MMKTLQDINVGKTLSQFTIIREEMSVKRNSVPVTNTDVISYNNAVKTMEQYICNYIFFTN